MPIGSANTAGQFHSIPANSWRTVLWVPIMPFTVTGFFLRTNHSVSTLVKWRAFMANVPFYLEGSFNRGGLGVPVGFWWGPYFQLDLWCGSSFSVFVFPYESNSTVLHPVNQF